MRNKTLILILFLVTSILIIGTWNARCELQAAPKPQEGQILVDEDVLDALVDEPEHQFQGAHESFLKKDWKAAASKIRKGAAFLKLEAGRAKDESKKALIASVKELEKLAAKVEKGTATSARELDNAFARAHQALGEHHYLRASKSWTKKAVSKAGHDLRAAANHLENSSAWAGHKLETGTGAVIKDARILAGKMIAGTGWVDEEVGKGIKSVGQEIEKLGKKIAPVKK